MADYILSCDSAADLSCEQYRKLGLRVMPLQYMLDDQVYTDDPDTFDPAAFYADLKTRTTSGAAYRTVEEYLDYFRGLLAEGVGVIHVTISSAIGEEYTRASGAAVILKMLDPSIRLAVVDSLCASGGIGLLLQKAASLRDEGYSMDELKTWIEDNRLKVNHLFYTTDLSQLIKSGRISEASGKIATRMEICPILRVNSWGELVSYKNVRKAENVLRRTVSGMKQLADKKKNYDDRVLITQAVREEEAGRLKDMVWKEMPAARDIYIRPIGAVIGVHTGEGTVALFFWGKERTV